MSRRRGEISIGVGVDQRHGYSTGVRIQGILGTRGTRVRDMNILIRYSGAWIWGSTSHAWHMGIDGRRSH